MAYPFAPAITFIEFRTKLLNEYGCTYHSLTGLAISGGTIHFLQRTVNGIPENVVVSIPDHNVIAPSMIRSICARLGVDPEAFGFSLG